MMNTTTPILEDSRTEEHAQAHLDLQQARPDLSPTHCAKQPVADPNLPYDSNNQTSTLTIQTESKLGDEIIAKEDKLTTSNSAEKSQNVSVDKYNKLKRKFSVLR